MNFKSIFFYLSYFCFPITLLSILSLLYNSYFQYFLNLKGYSLTLIISLIIGSVFFYYGKNSSKKINFYEQLILIIFVFLLSGIFISIPYFLSGYNLNFIDSFFESISGLTLTGFSIIPNINRIDPTLIIWRSSSQWIGGLYFLIFLVLIFSNKQFNYKLNFLSFSNYINIFDKSNIQNIIIKIFIIYSVLTILIFSLFNISGIRLFNSLNLSMTVISTGGFLPTSSLGKIITTKSQEIILILGFVLSIINFFIILNFLSVKKLVRHHFEDLTIIIIALSSGVILYFLNAGTNFLSILTNVFSSLSSSGITSYYVGENFIFFYLFLVLLGGSVISNTSGLKFMRIYVLLKTSYSDLIKLVKPNNIINQNILNTELKLDRSVVKISFLVFISFFISILILSGLLIIDEINFENSFKLSTLTLTNTVASNLYGLSGIDFYNLLTSTKISLIIFMIIGKIELISVILIFKKIFFKD